MKKLYRSKSNRQLCGVCGGLGEYFNIDATIIRLILVVIGLCTAIIGALIAYIIAAVVVPEEPDYYDV
jgi:phage shock protein C